MGCGASSEGEGGQKRKYTSRDESTFEGARAKYLVDVGAVTMSLEDKKTPATLIAFVSNSGQTTFTYYHHKSHKMYVAAYTDSEFKKLLKEGGVTYDAQSVFKSIATVLTKGKAKVTPTDQLVSVDINISHAQDSAQPSQALRVTMSLSTESSSNTIIFFVSPLTQVAQRRRVATEEREIEGKVSKLRNDKMLMDASIAASKVTVERLRPALQPLRRESAEHSKSAAELASKVAQVERKLRNLQESGTKSRLDGLYEDGGARSFVHLPQAEEHRPKAKDFSDLASVEWLRVAFPLKEGETLAAITKAPSDPRLQQMLQKAPQKVIEETMQLLTKLDSWDMNVFEIEKKTDGCALFHVTYALLYKLDLINALNIDDTILRNFLGAMQAGYHPNPYHNATHAADVAQINYFIMTAGGLVEKCKLSKEEVFAGVIAGAMHDYDHPGFNNNFHTRTNAYLSTLYNDRSILENHHCACIFEMMRLPKYNVMANFNEDQRREIRDTIIEMVLATDMTNHGKIFSSFRRRLQESPEWHERKDDVRLALSMSIKMADISNCGRPNLLYLEWAKNIANEFYAQGDAEANAGLSISPFMDRRKDKQEFPKGQISFMNFIVVPMLEAIAEFLPPIDFALNHCRENKEYWQSLD